MHFITIGVRRVLAATFGMLVLAGCGSERTPGEPVRVAECSAWIQTRLIDPASFQSRGVRDQPHLEAYRFTTIQFRANMEQGGPIACEARCHIRNADDQFVPERSTISGEAAGGSCLAVRQTPAA